MSQTPYFPPTDLRAGDGFSQFYLIIGLAAVFSVVVIPLAFLVVFRHYRRLSSLEPALFPGGVLGVEEKLQQEEPKFFDLYVKPDLQLDETRLEDLLPMAVRMASTDPGEKRNTASHRSSRSPGWEADNPEALTSQAYDVAVLIKMPTPHPRVKDNWDELDEYAIGSLKLSVTNSPDDSTHH